MSGSSGVVIHPGSTEIVQAEPPGTLALLSGIGYFSNGTTPISWTAAADVVSVPSGVDGNWDVSLGTLTQGYGTFTNPVLQPYAAYQTIGVFGDPSLTVNSATSADNIAVQFGSPVPLGNSILFNAPGGTLISGDIDEQGPYTFTFVAALNGVPVSTAGWSFSVQTPSGKAPAWTYAINAALGTVAVTTGSAIVPSPDAIIVVTPNNTFDTLSVTGVTIPVDAWSLSIAPDTPCYVKGTRIATPSGDVLIEQLGIGDLIVTQSGSARPVKWIGRRSYAGRFLLANPQVQPVRFRAGSLGDGLPRRDLLVSPEHAMFLDGFLIPAGHLVNGVGIRREREMNRVDYFHIELETHDVIFAEGAASETFLDDDSRAMFHNATEFTARYGDECEGNAFCAPRISEGFDLEEICERLISFREEVAA